MSSNNAIRLTLEIKREDDDSFSVGLEDDRFGDSDQRYVDGVSEGQILDSEGAVAAAASYSREWMRNHIDLIAEAMEFNKAV